MLECANRESFADLGYLFAAGYVRASQLVQFSYTFQDVVFERRLQKYVLNTQTQSLADRWILASDNKLPRKIQYNYSL